jgi:hypothetical protein
MGVGNILNVDDVHQLIQVGLNFARFDPFAVHDDGHARDFGVFGAADIQRLNIEVPAPEQGGHPVQHARFIFD